MTQTDKLLVRKEAGVGIVTFNNPKRHNAVSLDMWEACTRILEQFAGDDEVRAVVLSRSRRQGIRIGRRYFEIRQRAGLNQSDTRLRRHDRRSVQ